MTTLKTALNQKRGNDFFAISNGLDFDKRIFDEEIQVQRAWLQELNKIQIVTAKEFKKIDSALKKAQTLHTKGVFPWSIADEDIHMNIESFLTKTCGSCAKKIHIGRSRNDLIATTLRLYMKNQIHEMNEKLSALAGAALDRAEAFSTHLIPAFTHMQSAQPIRMGQTFLAYAYWVQRDIARLSAVAENTMQYMPLGSGAINGTHLPVDLQRLAKNLDFKNPSYCSYDAVGDRDFLQEFTGAIAIFASHLSRICNDVIFLSSTPVSALILPQEWSSGSSIMPNKRNPDLFEIVRAKSARMMAASSEINTVFQALPSGYSSDLHETKRIIARTLDELNYCLEPMTDALAKMEVNAERLDQILNQGNILATDIANAEVAAGKTFRDSYRHTAILVKKAQADGRQVHELSGQHSFARSVESRNNIGGNSLRQLQNSIKQLRKHSS